MVFLKKALQSFMVWFLIAFFAIAAAPLVLSQQTPSPQPTSATSQMAGIPVVFEGQTLFTINSRVGTLSPKARQIRAETRIAEFAQDYELSIDDLTVNSVDEGIPINFITAGHILITLVTEQDAKIAGKNRSELANEILQKIRSAVEQYRRERSFEHLLRGVVFSVLATLILIFVLGIINKLFARIYQGLLAWEESHIRPICLGEFEIIGVNQLDNVITFLIKIIQAVIVLGLFVTYFTFVLHQFPWTRNFTRTFWGQLLGKLQEGWQNFVAYLPSLLTIALILVGAYFLIRLFKGFFQKISEGSINLPNFYPEWAEPTFKIVSFLTYALVAVAIFPFLPGFQSPAFQGIGVFLGLLFSLGSTSVIANIVSGTVLIYTRSFRVGDDITVGQVTGQVLEKTLLVTRLLTLTNEVVSIPNSQIISGSIKNLKYAIQELDKPLAIKATVYLGYEVPWRQAYEALLQAALRTEGVAAYPAPYVLQGELNEVYVTYYLKVYLEVAFVREKTEKEFEQIRSQVNENIRDACAEAEIRIFSPTYYPDPTIYGPAADN